LVLTAALVAIVGALWLGYERWRNARHPASEEFEEREAQHGFRLVMALAALLVALVIALVLDGLGIDLGGWLALVIVLAGLVVFYVGPWVGPRRPKPPR
jgi:predicted histidine transporter YuiF (NhaC family)